MKCFFITFYLCVCRAVVVVTASLRAVHGWLEQNKETKKNGVRFCARKPINRTPVKDIPDISWRF